MRLQLRFCPRPHHAGKHTALRKPPSKWVEGLLPLPQEPLPGSQPFGSRWRILHQFLLSVYHNLPYLHVLSGVD